MPVSNGTKKTVPPARTAVKPGNEQTSHPQAPKQGFGLAQAAVIGLFLAAAVVLRLVAKMEVNEIGILLCWAGGIGVLVVLASNAGGGGGGPRRLLRRVLSAAAGNPTN
ncbi:hypothetical protein ACFUAG_34505 [Streptomyces sp. NPDC057193]|uniref:hypothetical protein n=1 Tax=Streptomyces sp. NPDC057193 TaxID=3346043 RepID=UPI00362F8DFE